MSVYFDALRLMAAVLVVIEHLRLFGLVPSSFPLSTYSHEAVLAFFVLSGAVIAHAANRPAMTYRKFAVGRVARIYSVAIPAIVLAYTLSMIVSSVGGIELRDGAQNEKPNVSSFLTTLLFLNENWFVWNEAWWNGPYWSLCYEVWYYIIFACYRYGSDRYRLLTALLAAAIAGPRILVLFPMWLLGTWFTRISGHIPERPRVGVAIFASSLACIVLINSAELGEKVWAALHSAYPQTWVLQSSSFVVTDYLYGVLFFLNFVGVQMCAGVVCRVLRRYAVTIRYLAGGTFSVYLFHYPIVMAIAAMTRGVSITMLMSVALVIGVVMICWMLSFLTERRKGLIVGVLS